MKTLFTLSITCTTLILFYTSVNACDLDPTAVISVNPGDDVVFFDGDYISLDGYSSLANCGYITEYTWYIDLGPFYQTVSTNADYFPDSSLNQGQDSRELDILLRVRNSVGNYGYASITIRIVREPSSYYYLTDHLGSVRVTVNDEGDPVGWDDYYPFGLQMPGRTQNQSNPNDDAKFTGYLLEQEGDLGLYHAEARMYDPVIGRFNSVDPLASVFPGWTPYTYALNNPLIYIDPDGRLSTHVDSTGNVIAVYDDGDLGVYQHSDLGSGDGSSVAERRTNTSTTHGGGTQVGHTLHERSFSVGNQIDLSSDNTGGQFIDYFYAQAGQMTLLGYARSAIDGGSLDVKNQTNIGGFVDGGSGLIVSSRDVGNIVAGMVARDYSLLTPNILAAYGEFNIRRGLRGGRKTDAVISIILGMGTSAVLPPNQAAVQGSMFLKEDHETIKGILYGLSRR